MLDERSFSQILEDLDDRSQIENSNFDWNSGWESSLEPAYISQLISKIHVQAYPSAQKAFAIYRKGPSRQTSAQPVPVRTPHILNEEQSLAFRTLCSYQKEHFSEAFNLAELKSAYRQALLKTHPDQGGTAESFQVIRKSYEILRAFVTKPM